MALVLPSNYAPLNAASLHALIHGTAPGPASAPSQALTVATDADRFERTTTSIPARHRAPDVSANLEDLQNWRALAARAQALNPVDDRKEMQRSEKHAAIMTADFLREERNDLCFEIRRLLRRPRRAFSQRLSKMRHRVKALRINLRASGWPLNHLPLRHCQYASNQTDTWWEQVRAWDRAMGSA